MIVHKSFLITYRRPSISTCPSVSVRLKFSVRRSMFHAASLEASTHSSLVAAQRIGGFKAMEIQVRVNGKAHQISVQPRLFLVHYLRDLLGLTGTHVECQTSFDGAFTILLDC